MHVAESPNQHELDLAELRERLIRLRRNISQSSTVPQTMNYLGIKRGTVYYRLKLPDIHPLTLRADPRHPGIRITNESIYRCLCDRVEARGWERLVRDVERLFNSSN